MCSYLPLSVFAGRQRQLAAARPATRRLTCLARAPCISSSIWTPRSQFSVQAAQKAVKTSVYFTEIVDGFHMLRTHSNLGADRRNRSTLWGASGGRDFELCEMRLVIWALPCLSSRRPLAPSAQRRTRCTLS